MRPRLIIYRHVQNMSTSVYVQPTLAVPHPGEPIEPSNILDEALRFLQRCFNSSMLQFLSYQKSESYAGSHNGQEPKEKKGFPFWRETRNGQATRESFC